MMADKVSKILLQYAVAGNTEAVNSLSRLQSQINNTKKASDQLHDSLTDIRVEAASVELGRKYGEMAKDIEKADDAAASLSAELQKIGASQSDIAAAAREFENFRTAQDTAGGGASQLTQLGSKLRSLPSVQIPGAGIGTDAIGNLTRLLGTLPPAILPVIALLGGVTAGFVLLGKSLEDAKAKVQAAIEAQNKYFQQLQDFNSKQAQLEIDRLKIRNELIRAQVESELNVIEIGKQGVVDSFSGLFDAFGLLFGEARENLLKEAATAGVSKDVLDNLDKLKKEYDQNVTSIDLLTGGLKDGAFAANDMTEALKQFNAVVTDQTIHSIQERANVQQEIDKLIAEGSEKDLDAKRKAAEATQKNAELQLKDLKANIDAAEKGSDAQKKYQAEFDKQLQTYNDATYELGQLGQSAVRAAVQLNDAKEYTEKQNKELADATKKYNADLAKENEANLAKKADIEKKYQDNLIKAAETLADAGEKALQTLKDKRDDLLTNFRRGEASAAAKAQQKSLEDQIKYQEDSAKSAREHARDLRDIQQKAQQNEEDLIAARDFAGLFKSRRNTTIAIQNSNRDFQEQEAERQLQFQQKNESDARQYQFEQQQRLIAYQNQNQDAERQYNRQLAQAQANYQKSLQQNAAAKAQELQLEYQRHLQSVNILRSGIQSELSVISQGAQARIQLEAATQQALIQQAQQILASVTGGGLLGNGRAGFGAGSTGFGGLGSVTSNSGNSVTNNFSIRGNNPQAIANLVETQVNKSLRTYLVN